MNAAEIRRAENEVTALHARVHETFLLRGKSQVHRRKWKDACRALHAYRHSVFELERAEILAKVRAGAEPWRNDALLFLEVDPWFFRSGYLKQKLLRALKGAVLTPDEVVRLTDVFLVVVDSRDRREFKEYCRLAAKVGATELRNGLTARLEASDEQVRRRAIEMLHYLDEHGAA